MKVWLLLGLLVSALGARAATGVFEMPSVYPKHLQLRQQLIQALRAGKTDEMERVCRAGVELLPQDATWQYNLACALAYRADKAEALAALDRAIDLGFRDARAIRSDNDLKPLAASPTFTLLVKKAEALAGRPVAGAVAVRPATAFMGLPAEMTASNTVWDFDVGCFKTLFALKNADLKPVSAYASDYRGPAAESIRGWMKEESASGNFGDLYVNRDDGHSTLAVTNFPGLTPVSYAGEARAQRVHLSMPNTLFDYPVLGNSSMSMVNGPLWRSLARAVVSDPYQPLAAFRFYVGNQCWFYPEHRDYDPETGDLFPANTPYYVVSQGSSFSDQPFLAAFASAMAALRPATKRALVARGMLAPTLQMVFRATLKTVRKPEDYLTGAAHPAVFDAAQLDAEAMAKMAHGLAPEDIPPLVALRTLKDAQPEMGTDFFDLRPEGLFDTPFSIARVVRGISRQRSMTLEAAASAKPIEVDYLWVVLQGDAKKVVIRPLTPNASQVEITVAYHGVYRPQGADGQPSPIQSSRVDIGCFVKAGAHYSAPSFVSFYYLPNEDRAYRDDGQILSVDYTNAAHRYADPVLTMQKGWKDLYEYDAQGHLLGWYRTRSGGQPERFTYKGHKVLATDKLNRPVKACAVQYLPRQTGVEGAPPALACADTPQLFTYTYAGDSDKVGKTDMAPSK
ncbi:MAG TPA: hypothetical protein PKM57_17535 [Kiritimatiellia bacterium]|nr:hypothetical protein [Kiritimatiellia bacterium]HPS09145.1 hypothetical protein [Kiritimatiellia bacterium]